MPSAYTADSCFVSNTVDVSNNYGHNQTGEENVSKPFVLNKINDSESDSESTDTEYLDTDDEWLDNNSHNALCSVSTVHSNGQVHNSVGSLKPASIVLNLTGTSLITGVLPDTIPFVCLVDSGSTHNMLSDALISKSKYLSALTPLDLQVKPIIHTASGTSLSPTHSLTFDVNFEGFQITISAYIVSSFSMIHLILGHKSLSSLQAKFDFQRNQVTLTRARFPLFSVYKCAIGPSERSLISVRCTLPKLFADSDLICYISIPFADLHESLVMLHFDSGFSTIKLTNIQPISVTIDTNKPLGFVDLEMSALSFQSVHHIHQTSTETIFCTENNSTGFAAHVVGSNHHNTPFQHDTSEFVFDEQSRMTTQQLIDLRLRLYPWLDRDDPRLTKTDRQLIEQSIDLTTNCILSENEKSTVLSMLYENRKAWSLFDEIGSCSAFMVNFQVTPDLKPFYIRPYIVTQRDKELADIELRKLKQMGVLQEGRSDHVSPLLLLPKPLAPGEHPSKRKYRIIVDLKKLNSCIVKEFVSFPELKYVLQNIGSLQSIKFSCLDIRQAFFSLPLDPSCRRYCGVVPYHGAPTFIFRRLPQGLTVSPAQWNRIVTEIFSHLSSEDRQHIHIQTDDVLIHHNDMSIHLRVLDSILKLIIRFGLKLSINKAQIGRDNIRFLGLCIKAVDNKPCITPLSSRTSAIDKLPRPLTVRCIKSFAGVCQFLSQFCPRMSDLIKPLLDLTKKKNFTDKSEKRQPLQEYSKGKGRSKHSSYVISHLWTPEHTECFLKLKKLCVQAPILTLPNTSDTFLVECDTSRRSVGGALFQIQQNVPRLIAYYSSSLSNVSSYSVTELELTGLVKCVFHFRYLIQYTTFIILVDHKSLIHIHTNKHQVPTVRLQKLMVKLQRFSFKLAWKKGEKMYISDFLSRYGHMDSDYDDPLPFLEPSLQCVSSNDFQTAVQHMLNAPCISPSFQSNDPLQTSTVPALGFGVQTRSMYKRANIQPAPLFHSSGDKSVSSTRATPSKVSAKSKSKAKVQSGPKQMTSSSPGQLQKSSPKPQNVNPSTKGPTSTNVVQPTHTTIQRGQKVTRKNKTVKPKPQIGISGEIKQTKHSKQSPLLPGTDKLGKNEVLLPKPPTQQRRVGNQITLPISESSSLPQSDTDMQNGTSNQIVRSAHQQELDRQDYTQEIIDYFDGDLADINTPVKPLFQQITPKLISPHSLPNQKDIDAFLDILQHKSIKDFHMNIDKKELIEGQRNDPFFRPIYLYLAHDILPPQKVASRHIRNISEDYVLYDMVLLRYIINKTAVEQHKLVVCIPAKFVPRLLNLFHNNILSSHLGISKTYKSLKVHFYIRHLYNLLVNFVNACRICAARKPRNESKYQIPWRMRLFVEYCPFSVISIDIKTMPKSDNGDIGFLLARCSLTRYVETAILKDRTAVTIAELLYNVIITRYGVPHEICCDLDKAFCNQLLKSILAKLNTKLTFISVKNHQSLEAESSIKAVSQILFSQLRGKATNWPQFLSSANYAYNVTPHTSLSYSPYFLLYFRNPADMSNISDSLPKTVTKDYHEYVNLMQARFKLISKHILEKQNEIQEQRQQKHNMEAGLHYEFNVDDLVYVNSPKHTHLNPVLTGARKVVFTWVGPLRIHAKIDNSHFILQTLQGQILHNVFHHNRLKLAQVTLSDGTNTTSYVRLMEEYGKQIPPIQGELANAAFTYLLIDDKRPAQNSAQPIQCHLPSHGDNDWFCHKARYKVGKLQLLCYPAHLTNQSSHWIDLHAYPPLKDNLQNNESFFKSLKVTGSVNKFYSLLTIK